MSAETARGTHASFGSQAIQQTRHGDSENPTPAKLHWESLSPVRDASSAPCLTVPPPAERPAVFAMRRRPRGWLAPPVAEHSSRSFCRELRISAVISAKTRFSQHERDYAHGKDSEFQSQDVLVHLDGEVLLRPRISLTGRDITTRQAPLTWSRS